MRTLDYKTFYQSNGENFVVKMLNDGRGNSIQTIMDKTNEVAIQTFALNTTTPYYNVGAYKYPETNDIKKLEIVPTEETKKILGYNCKKYTYTYKKIFGEVWITDELNLSNDIGIFRAAKMASIHNTLSMNGFVMEMTTEDAKGGKTVIKTISLQKNESITISYKGVEMNTAINKVNYFTF
jgi:hypothetical protein